MEIMCPKCNIVASDEAWDEETEDIFGDDSEPIANVAGKDTDEEYWYICPHCYEQIDNKDLVVLPEED